MSDFSYFHNKIPYATEQVAVGGTAEALTTALVDNSANYPDFKASAAVVQVLDDGIYYTVDGTTPSSTNGILAQATSVIVLAGYQKVKNFQAIQQSSGATLNVQYFKN